MKALAAYVHARESRLASPVAFPKGSVMLGSSPPPAGGVQQYSRSQKSR